MDNPTVLVADKDPKNLQILKESLEAADFRVITTGNGNEAWSTIQSEKPDIVISEVDIPGIDGFKLFQKMQNDPVGASIPVVFLTNRRNLEDRLKSLRAGVKDYMIKPLHVKEVIARLKMIIRRIERIKTEETEPNRKHTGRLEDKSVENLVESYGIQRRTGVLTLYDQNNRSGEIYFREGAVVNARFGNFKAEKAVYQMLPWKHGHFLMTFKDLNIDDAITVSNLGLLLQGFKRMQHRERLIKRLPPLTTIFVKTPIFEKVLNKKAISTDALKFISLFDGKRTLNHILTESTYDDLKTLERVIKLSEQGFICPKDSPAPVLPKARRYSGTIQQSGPQIPREANAKPERKVPPELLERREIGKVEPPAPTVTNKRKQLESNKIPDFEEFKLEFNISDPLKEETTEQQAREVELENIKEPKNSPTFPVAGDSMMADDSAINGKAIAREANYDNYENLEHFDFAATCDDLLGERRRGPRHLLIISSHDRYRKELINTMTKGELSSKKIDSGHEHSIELGRVKTPSNRTMEIFGLSTERTFLQMLDQFESQLVGCIILAIADNSSNLGYLGYLINSLKGKLNAPFVIAVYQPPGTNPIPLDFIRYSLNLDEKEQLVTLNVSELDSVTHVLNQLKPPEYNNPPEKPSKKRAKEHLA